MIRMLLVGYCYRPWDHHGCGVNHSQSDTGG
jgi:hypothetical protein